ncbi:hypothetical protein Q1695_000072 [Nippostrongylus brasiliensis]|nr:hypothetical protein Q1695_000072 [Nippostrongylus brasiliensis]
MTRLVNRSQFVPPRKVRQGHETKEIFHKIIRIARAETSRWRAIVDGVRALPRPSVLEPLWTTAVRCCQRRGYKRFSVPHMFLHREGQGGRLQRSKEEDAPSPMATISPPVLKQRFLSFFVVSCCLQHR